MTRISASAVMEQLDKCGITHVVWLPDTQARFLYEPLARRSDIVKVPVCREGEAMAIAAGLSMGGKKPLVLHQNTGLLESGDSVRGMGIDLEVPVLMIIGLQGWRRGAPPTESAASYTEAFLNAFGVTYFFVEGNEDVSRISLAQEQAQQIRRPVAVLMKSTD